MSLMHTKPHKYKYILSLSKKKKYFYDQMYEFRNDFVLLGWVVELLIILFVNNY